MLEQCCNHPKQFRNNAATLCCAKNLRCESSRVTSTLLVHFVSEWRNRWFPYHPHCQLLCCPILKTELTTANTPPSKSSGPWIRWKNGCQPPIRFFWVFPYRIKHLHLTFSVAVRSSLAHFQWLFSDCLTGSVMVSSYIWLPDKTSWVAGGQAIFEWKYMFFQLFQQ